MLILEVTLRMLKVQVPVHAITDGLVPGRQDNI